MDDTHQSPVVMSGARFDETRLDDEHRLIARYVDSLATTLPGDADHHHHQQLPLPLLLTHEQRRQLVTELEAKNRAILREIQRLRLEQQQTAGSPAFSDHVIATRGSSRHFPPGSTGHVTGSQSQQQLQSVAGHALVDELRLLRRRRDELEDRMVALQSSRRELVWQLETLMTVLKSRSTTPSSSSRSPHPVDYDVRSPSLFPPGSSSDPAADRGAATSPPLAAVTGDIQQAFADATFMSVRQMAAAEPRSTSPPVPLGGLSRDLVEATDYVTGAVTSLVRELNSDDSGDNAEYVGEQEQYRSSDYASSFAGGCQWPADTRFLAELRRHRLFRSADNRQSPPDFNGCGSPSGSRDYLYDNDNNNLLQVPTRGGGSTAAGRCGIGSMATTSDAGDSTDQDSYIRTDDDDEMDVGNGTDVTDWEEARRRWINR